MIDEKSFLSPNEVNQSYVRTINTLLISTYVLGYSYFNEGVFFSNYTVPALLYLIITIPLYFWSLRCIALPADNIERHVFRVIGLSGDLLVLSIVMTFSGLGGAPLFFVYLWIIVGNGIRYGINYLKISTIISVILFCFVIYNTPVWQSEYLFPIAIGLLISLVILPLYILNLIKLLSYSLESERKANQLKDTFLANVNHEIRTPLNSIINLVELIRSNNLSSELLNYMEMIRASANTQLNIVNGILDFSKINSGEYKINHNIFDLYALLHEIYKIMFPHAINKELEFNIFISSDCENKFIGAHDQIKQILINLVGNSIKFTNSGSVNLNISTVDLLNTQIICFCVKDSGIGISDKISEEIFKPFVQDDMTLNRNYGERGTGLGLAISNELSNLINGKLSFNNKLDVGTEFFLEIELEKIRDKLKEDISVNLIFALIESNDASNVISIYSKLGIKIKNLNLKEVSMLVTTINESKCSVFIFEKSLLDEEKLDIEILNKISLPKIIISDTEDNINNYSMTSLSYKSETKNIENAILICSKFYTGDNNYENKLKSCNQNDILLVEDDLILRTVNENVLKESGYNLDTIDSGLGALRKLTEKKYDLVILDLHLQDITGYEVAMQYISNYKNPSPLILLTADNIEINNYKNIYTVFDKVIIKPINPNKLIGVISELLNKNTINIKSNSYIKDNLNKEMLDYDIIDQHLKVVGITKFNQMLEIYDSEIKNIINILTNKKMEKQDRKIKSLIHKIKGASSTFGALGFCAFLNIITKDDINVNNYINQENLKKLENIHLKTIQLTRNYVLNYYEK